MKRLLLINSLSVAFVGSFAFAQVAPHARDGRAVERLQSISVPAKAGSPFSATVVTEWTRVLEDGSKTTVKNHRTIARDSTGRVFEERRYLNASGDVNETPLSALEYTDPVRHERTSCNPGALVCFVQPFNYAEAPPEALPASVTLPNGAGTIKREDLGHQTIDNVDVEGSREITMINPGENGYKQAEPTIKEFWYSSRLGLNLIVKRFEPRGGAEDFAVTKLNLNEPDPRLFTPPANYKIVQMPASRVH